MTCPYREIFGRPGEGLHKYRIGGLAVVDLALTAGLAIAVARTWLGALVVFCLLLVLATATHEYFCVNTRLTAAVFGRPYGPAAGPPEK